MQRGSSVAKISGMVGCVLGLTWIAFFFVNPVISGIRNSADFLVYCLPLVLGLPGILLVVCSIKLIREQPTRSLIKNVFGLMAGFGTLFGAFLYSLVFDEVLGADSAEWSIFFALFVSLIVMLWVYVKLACHVMGASGVVPVRGEFVGRGSFQILAFLMWLMLNPFLRDIGDSVDYSTYVAPLVLLLSIFIPYVFYRMAVKYWVRDTIDEQVALDYPSELAEAQKAQGNHSL